MDINVEGILEAVARLISTWGLKVLGALALLIIGWIAAKMVRGAVRRALERSNLDETLVPFLSKLVYYLFLTLVTVAVVTLLGIPATSFIAILGAAGLAVGFALQGTLSNFASGVMLLAFRPFRVGDFVDIAGTTGNVEEIGVFSTTLNTPDNVRIVAPNSAVYGETIKNYSVNDNRRNDMVMGISYDDDIGKALEIIRKIVEADPRVLQDPAPVIAVGELADSSVNLLVRPWCRKEDYWGLRFDLTRAFKEELEAAGCSIPYPQTDVHLHQVASA